MRWIVFCVFTPLAACGVPAQTPLSQQGPSLHVADAALAAGAPTIALNVANALLRAQPGNVEARTVAGEAQYQLGDLQAAKISFNRALLDQPHNDNAMLGLGRIELNTDPAQAQNCFERVAAAQPRSTAALTDLGIAYDLQGRHAAAQRMYHAALDITPGLPSAQTDLALSLKLTSAQDIATSAVETAPELAQSKADANVDGPAIRRPESSAADPVSHAGL